MVVTWSIVAFLPSDSCIIAKHLKTEIFFFGEIIPLAAGIETRKFQKCGVFSLQKHTKIEIMSSLNTDVSLLSRQI